MSDVVEYPPEFDAIRSEAFEAAHSVLAEHILRHKDKPYDPRVSSSVIAGAFNALISITEAVGTSNGDDIYRALDGHLVANLKRRFPGWTP